MTDHRPTPAEAEPATPTKGIARRSFLVGAAAAIGSFAFIQNLNSPVAHAAEDGILPVAIVGGGLAGLSTAYQLEKLGIGYALFEAQQRVGGRCFSSRGWGANQVAEHGGEFVDVGQNDILELAQEFGIGVEDRYAAMGDPVEYWKQTRYRYNDIDYTWDEVFSQNEALKVLAANPEAMADNQLDAEVWMDKWFGEYGGRNAPIYLYKNQRTTEAHNWKGQKGPVRPFSNLSSYAASNGGSDESLHIEGGNDRIAWGMADRLAPGALTMGADLRSIWRNSDGTYGLRFAGVSKTVTARRVALTMPFPALRRVDYSGAGFTDAKMQTIATGTLGQSIKLLIELRHRTDFYDGWNGQVSINQPYMETWYTSLSQRGRESVITVLAGGESVSEFPATVPHGPASTAVLRKTLQALEPTVPGITSAFTGKSWLDHWPSDPYAGGSWSASGGAELNRINGGVHFHASSSYLNHAVGGGKRLAQELVASGI